MEKSHDDHNVVDIIKMTALQICQIFNVTNDLCTCPSIHPIMIQICRVEKTRQKSKVSCESAFQRREILTVPLSLAGIVGNFLVILVTKQQ